MIIELASPIHGATHLVVRELIASVETEHAFVTGALGSLVGDAFQPAAFLQPVRIEIEGASFAALAAAAAPELGEIVGAWAASA